MLVISGRPNLKMSWRYLVLRLMMERELCSKQLSSVLCKAILAAPALSVHKLVDHWIEEGNEVTRSVIASTMFHLQKRRMFESALEFSEWLELEGHEFGERDYASRVDLIAKVHGLQKTESYIANIPKSFQGEVVYRTLLANCVPVANVKKAEEVFNKMEGSGIPNYKHCL
nr:pentatricopeptide repeat-containing protein At1g80270, mitochondrial-like [Coffea arabica]XP_027066155.1 pentatricopeptide repeat-containing protein At1g80270, mitochondrial-like [Coffea arabica]XP_027066156.1 pentatricopeptide repeat-containing protein At1g80270, mitochondrial-like [Coffea arabica]XP_027066158.1 pentatricopeptide repeat-containing protein At1g80270, mitochondrial-like [Coffea arabica]XP_027066159.1 pentatricopeptide repeat-containing protein At1g80270, mitochondrial-like [C